MVPAGVRLAIRLIPAAVLAECRSRAREEPGAGTPKAARTAAFVIIALWVLCLLWLFRLAAGFLRRGG